MTTDPPSFEIRAALPSDEADLLALASHLNTVNLPADPGAIAGILAKSKQSFEGALPAPQRVYVFILRDCSSGRAIGTSTLVAQLGRPDAPYIYFDVDKEEKYSRDQSLHFTHSVLRLGFSFAGPTELAGLVVDPAYRNHPGRLGLAVSYVRFLFVAAHRQLFQQELLAELLPPLEPDGTSHLWNSLGRRFTGMTYRHADRLSHENKDFIRDLFPLGPVYASLLSEPAQAVIGKVGHQTQGVEKMLRRVGFRYVHRVDPFDGGPHFCANVDDVTVIRAHHSGRSHVDDTATTACLAARLTPGAPHLVALPTRARVTEAGISLPQAALDALGAATGDVVHTVPLP
jgi:arginine N-succinyltransferase